MSAVDIADLRASGTSKQVVSASSVVKSFGSRLVLDQLAISIDRGEFVALLGASGCGKTTLVRIFAGLEQADAGEVHVPDARAVVFQEPRLLPWTSVWRNVALGRKPVERSKVERVLAEVGLSDHADAWPLTLSGGEAQRVALARALIREPELLLLDEPFAALDALTRLKMHLLVERLIANYRPATLLVTHDVDEAILLADRVAVMSGGVILEDLTVALPRPRLRGGPGFDQLRMSLLAHLGVAPDPLAAGETSGL
jgi:sulfonate transport system ATP-binding protein